MRYGGNLCPEKSVAMAQGFEERKRLTFEQAEGAEPLPSQLKPKELSKELRALLFEAIWLSMKGGLYIDGLAIGVISHMIFTYCDDSDPPMNLKIAILTLHIS
jgi:hypothetical protein